MPNRRLHGKVALVAGATRGAGRGIARMLGEAGATVYCTGRSTRSDQRAVASRDPTRPFATSARPETIEETAELVDAAGGRGIAIRADHTKAHDVEFVVSTIWHREERLDILVNDIWGGDDAIAWGKPFWELGTEQGLAVVDKVLHTHVLTSRAALPFFVSQRHPALIVEITDGDFLGYRGNFYYDMAKILAARMAYALACDLSEKGMEHITSLAVTPGFLRSEAMLEHFGVTESNWRDAIKVDRHFSESETPCFVGRAVAALACDPKVRRKAGGVFASWTLAEEYGFTDIDGRRPHFGRYFQNVVAAVLEKADQATEEERDLALAWYRHHEFNATLRDQLLLVKSFLTSQKHAH